MASYILAGDADTDSFTDGRTIATLYTHAVSALTRHYDNSHCILLDLIDDFRAFTPRNSRAAWQTLYSPFPETRQGFGVKKRKRPVRLSLWLRNRAYRNRDFSLRRFDAGQMEGLQGRYLAAYKRKMRCLRS